jgi:aspartokinase-like uncharacterized kinase
VTKLFDAARIGTTWESADVPAIVAKVGGSLLDYGPLRGALADWLARQREAVRVVIAGGGRLAGAIRRMDETLDLGEEASHWLAIDAMRVAARVVHRLVPAARWIADWQELVDATRAKEPAIIVYDAGQFLREIEPNLPGTALPATWQVTSDSIAARLTECLGATELVLLKSTDPPATPSRRIASRLGLVDGFFGEATDRLKAVRFVNLRKPGFPEAALLP